MITIIKKFYSFISYFYMKFLKRCHIGERVLILFPNKILNGKNITLGENCFIGQNCRLCCYSYSGKHFGRIIIGDNFYAQKNLLISSLESGRVEIGNDVLIGSDVMINDNNHIILPKNLKYPFECGEVKIGNHVWIGEKACILRNVHIGDYVVVGAGSIVTKDIPSYTMVAGNPAKPIKRWNPEINEWEKIRK